MGRVDASADRGGGHRAAVRAAWDDAGPLLMGICDDLEAGRWSALDRHAMSLGSLALDLAITAAELPTWVERRVDSVVGALLRVSDLATRAAAVRPEDPRRVDDVLAMVDAETAQARQMWRGVEMALDRSPRPHLRAV